MIYLISYDLHRPVQNYAELYKAIKALGTCVHPLESTWLVDTGLVTATAVYERLVPHIDKDDRMLVIGVTRDRHGWLSKEIWDWIDSRAYERAA